MSDNDKVLDRIRKLLALATSDNVNEAANAAAMAERLMTEHKLAAADVEAETGKADDEPVIETTVVEDGRTLVGWRATLIGVLAGVNGCTHIFSWKKQETRKPRCPHMVKSPNSAFSKPAYRCALETRHDGACTIYPAFGTDLRPDEIAITSGAPVRCFKIIGRTSEAQAVTYLFAYLCNEINRLCNRDGKGQGKAFANSFRHGAVATISERLYAEKRAREAQFQAAADAGEKRSSVALMAIDRDAQAVDAFMKKAYPKLRTVRIGGASDYDGYGAGQRAAKSINLSGGAQLGAAPKRIGGRP